MLDGVTPLVLNPTPANFTTDDTNTQPLSYGDHMVNLIFGRLDKRRSFIIRQNPAVWCASSGK